MLKCQGPDVPLHSILPTLRGSPTPGFCEYGATMIIYPGTWFMSTIGELLHLDPVRLRKSWHAPWVASTWSDTVPW